MLLKTDKVTFHFCQCGFLYAQRSRWAQGIEPTRPLKRFLCFGITSNVEELIAARKVLL